MSTSLVFDKVNNDILADRKTAQANTQIIVSAASQIGMASQQRKSLREGVNELVGEFDASALFGDVEPDVVEVGCGLRRYSVRH